MRADAFGIVLSNGELAAEVNHSADWDYDMPVVILDRETWERVVNEIREFRASSIDNKQWDEVDEARVVALLKDCGEDVK